MSHEPESYDTQTEDPGVGISQPRHIRMGRWRRNVKIGRNEKGSRGPVWDGRIPSSTSIPARPYLGLSTRSSNSGEWPSFELVASTRKQCHRRKLF
ncbi:unnamed protein product [Nezara viridula]|uniref:Uncharacterized protein n=1 Tax=Nezara viridula TaxID=85310 RepID=A0A9P0MN52_NEZVI|nr:unnamed protein product [Nezara viridula]